MIRQIPPLDDEIGARARSARIGNTLYLANIPGISEKNIKVNYIIKRPDEIFGLSRLIVQGIHQIDHELHLFIIHDLPGFESERSKHAGALYVLRHVQQEVTH